MPILLWLLGIPIPLIILISAAVKKAATAVGLALFLWLILVYFGDLGLMGTSVCMKSSISANPMSLRPVDETIPLVNDCRRP